MIDLFLAAWIDKFGGYVHMLSIVAEYLNYNCGS